METEAFGNLHGGESSWGRVLGESSLLDLIAEQGARVAPLPAAEAGMADRRPGSRKGGTRWRSPEVLRLPLRMVGTTVEGHPG